MSIKIIYPSVDKIIEYNLLVLNIIKVKKADKAKVLSIKHIYDVIEECEEIKGDIYDKAIILLKGLIKKHPFASGNRRTAFIATKYFVLTNKAKFRIKDEPQYARVMQGIREDYYSKEEIKEWIKNGKIREFKR
ncbi:MAG: type II toxin-antitoxin system death-on-curing family toxin [Nanoarchaeota archaeon]|nr:type II toxin-antitoxin system death-on-curing family toxin [DPANN group archaeon]MBL7116552.1 type II toxin-antitoxin system death-on-curing family toxin [Nanoarchaeota archaeon]